MNREQIAGLWKHASGIVKEQWGTLTRNHAYKLAGRRDQAAGRILRQHGVSRWQNERVLKEFRKEHRDWNLRY